MRNSKSAPNVNAGSMADIAFLLLIFFLVTTTIAENKGFNRKLPKICETPDCIIDIHERNILKITLNSKQEIMANDEVISIENLKKIAINFLDNNGDETCDYCNGSKLTTSSDNPTKAVISFKSHKQTRYSLFIAVQDELTKAYYELRENYAMQKLGKTSENLSKEDIVLIRKAYPFILSEAETK